MTGALPPAVLAGIGLIAGGLVLLELVLTRLFAVTVWYYFGFLAVSLAMAGTAFAAGYCAARAGRWNAADVRPMLGRWALGFALLTPLAVFVHVAVGFERCRLPWTCALAASGQLLLLGSAFFAAGICLAAALSAAGQRLGIAYAADLFGACAGSALFVPLLSTLSLPALVWVVSAIGAVGGWCFLHRVARRGRLRLVCGLFAAASLVLAAGSDRWGLFRLRSVKSFEPARLQDAERDLVFERWSPVSRVAVHAPRRLGGIEYMQITNDAGAQTPLRRFDGDFAALEREPRRPWQVVHHLVPAADVLVIGSGGGDDVLTSLALNQRSVTAVELNRVIVDLVTRRYAGYIGRIFEDPRVTLHAAEGRNFVARSARRFDVIQITMIDSWAGAVGGAYIFNENGLYTREAVRDYLAHLTDRGWLSITRFTAWDETLRLTNLALDSLEAAGVRHGARHLAVVAEPFSSPHRRATVLVSRRPITPAGAAVLLDRARQGRFDVIYAPHVPAGAFESSEEGARIRALIAAADRPDARRAAVRRYPRVLESPTDDRPFFFFTHRLRDALRLDPSEHASRRPALPVLCGAIAALGLASGLLLLVPLHRRGPAGLRGSPGAARRLGMCAAFGMGYLLIELGLMQRFTLFLGHPTTAFTVVLAVLLAGSGAGSLLSCRASLAQAERWLRRASGGACVLALLLAGIVYDRLPALIGLTTPVRLLLAVILLAPPAVLMGMCLPLALRLGGAGRPVFVAWGWGVNGMWSVFASALSLFLALFAGLKVVLLAGAASYACAAALSPGLNGERARPVRRVEETGDVAADECAIVH